MISVFLAAFLASFLFIATKAMQQLNVVHHNRLAIIPTSLLMASCEVFVVKNMADLGFGWIVVPIGLGSGLGALASMTIHKWLRSRGREIL